MDFIKLKILKYRLYIIRCVLLISCIVIVFSCVTKSVQPKVNDSAFTFYKVNLEDSLVLVRHLFQDQIFLVEETKFDQTIRLQVVNPNVYKKYIENINLRDAGSDLFQYKCSSCHSVVPNIEEILILNFESSNSSLLKKLKSSDRHFDKSEVFFQDLNIDEIEAIRQYLKELPRKLD